MTRALATLAVLLIPVSGWALPPCGGGGRIVNAGSLSLSNCEITGQSTGGNGGGIENSGTLDLTNVLISGNSATTGGGGIYNTSFLSMTNVTITGNTTAASGGGVLNIGGTIFMTDVTITNNTAGTGGGGIANPQGTIDGSSITLSGNIATTGVGGGVWNQGALCFAFNCSVSASGGQTLITGNTATAGSGGGIANDDGFLVVSDSTITSNHANGGDGGGVWTKFVAVGGFTSLVGTTISTNTASGNGAGLYNDGGFVQGPIGGAPNLTIAANAATGIGGAAYTLNAGMTIFDNTTITDNTATGSSPGVYNDDGTGGVTEIQNTLLARQTPNCTGTIQSDGHNLDTGTTCALSGTGDLSNVGDAKIGTLSANGGPIRGSTGNTAALLTIPLQRESVAVNAGDTCPATDERGVARPQGLACDIGAYELILTAIRHKATQD